VRLHRQIADLKTSADLLKTFGILPASYRLSLSLVVSASASQADVEELKRLYSELLAMAGGELFHDTPMIHECLPYLSGLETGFEPDVIQKARFILDFFREGRMDTTTAHDYARAWHDGLKARD
jgi:hypothetical protein